MEGNPENSLFLVMMAIILLRDKQIDAPAHEIEIPMSVGPRPILLVPPQGITPIESVNLLRHVRGVFDLHPENRRLTRSRPLPCS